MLTTWYQVQRTFSAAVVVTNSPIGPALFSSCTSCALGTSLIGLMAPLPTLTAVAAALLLLLASPATSIFIDQIGRDDRIVQHVGPPLFAVAHGKSVVVGTTAGTLASLSIRTGAIGWRSVLGDGEPAGVIS